MKFKYVGHYYQANEYDAPIPEMDAVYDENDIIGNRPVKNWALDHNSSEVRGEWERVDGFGILGTLCGDYRNYHRINSAKKTVPFSEKIDVLMSETKKMLVEKNRKYGNSALEPVRIASKASAEEQLLVRIDDKLSRLKSAQNDETEDIWTDLLGYIILLKLSREKL